MTEFFHLGERPPSHGPVSHWQGHHSIALMICEEPGRNYRRQTVLHLQHHSWGPILQICPLQRPLDLVFPHKGRNATVGPSAGHLPPGLLQLTLGWTHLFRLHLNPFFLSYFIDGNMLLVLSCEKCMEFIVTNLTFNKNYYSLSTCNKKLK